LPGSLSDSAITVEEVCLERMVEVM
jgi:hypothetical protein